MPQDEGDKTLQHPRVRQKVSHISGFDSRLRNNEKQTTMNEFEIEIKKVKAECEKELIRLSRNARGLRLDHMRRMFHLRSEYNERKNRLDMHLLELKKKLREMRDVDGFLELEDAIANTHREMRYYKEKFESDKFYERGDLNAYIEDIEIEKRVLRQQMELSLIEIKKRYAQWINEHDRLKEYTNKSTE